AACDLVRGLALCPQRDEEAGDLGVRRLAGHDHRHRPAGFVAAQVVAVEQPGESLLDHNRPSRKLRARAGPSGVRTDSGWNWTPAIWSDRCRTAITSPSSAYAVGSSSSGKRVAASEWYRPASNGSGRPVKSPVPPSLTGLAFPCRSSRA